MSNYDNPYYPGYGDPSDPPGTTPLDPKQRYNLQNQSWGLPRKDKTGTLTDPIDIYNIEYPNQFPNNTEVVWTGLQYQPVVGTANPYERVFPNLYREVLGAGALAPKGFYIIDLLNRGASRKAAFEQNYDNANNTLSVPTFDPVEDRTVGGPSIVCQFAGRVFYAGFQGGVVGGDDLSPNLSNYVVFSQLVKNHTEIAKCYQEGDPTSRDSSEVVDTDGGYIRISGAKKLIAMHPMRTALIVFADNGIWAISGSGDSGFTATSYTVSALSSYGCVSATSIVVEGERTFYWGEEGIHIIQRDKFAQFLVENITQKSIQGYYDQIPLECKKTCKGVYDSATKRITWLFKEGTSFTSNSVTRELILDTTISAFSVHKIYNPSDYTHEVISSLFDEYVKYVFLKKSGTSTSFGFASYRADSFKDWDTYGGVDAKAYLITGSNTANDSAIAKQAPYLVAHMKKTETGVTDEGEPINPSGCLMRPQWDWSYNTNSKKFGTLAQIYKYRNILSSGYTDNGFDTVVTKSKLRGRGKALSLYFETEPGKDCHILGWSLTLNGNAVT